MEKIIDVRKNAYFDSVTLMTLSNKLKKLEGVSDAVVVMGTDMNKEQAASVGLSNSDVEGATANDLIVAVAAETQDACEKAYSMFDELLKSKVAKKSKSEQRFPTIGAAKAANPGLNFAVISVAGEYAAREARIALQNDMHVMLFSDNVTVEQEKNIKTLAHEKGLLVMGPDCGTAIINGVGLCFANAVKRGNIGLVAASGTGLQEVTVLIDNLGGGISQAIGTGGRDLSAEIGGVMMLDGIELLDKDDETKIIVLVSKPPVKEVAQKVLERVKNCSKPVVICFIDGSRELLSGTDAIYAANLEHAAVQAVAAANAEKSGDGGVSRFALPAERIKAAVAALKPSQKYIRGLFCGGTLAAEALSCISREADDYFSNVAKKAEHKMSDPMKSAAHTIVDLGDDVFTVGRPHPMIEPELRLERLIHEGNDPETAVILLDFELGFGSHENPVGVTIDAIKEISSARPEVATVAYILGTTQDYQGLAAQKKMLEDAGVIVANSNLHAAQTALAIALRKGAM